MKKGVMVLGLVAVMSLSFSLLSYASTFSEFWYQDTNGSWKVKDGSGNIVTNAWLCDDAVSSNGQNIWYLIDSNGNMVSAGLVQDQTGNIYSLETSHNGYYGMLRYQSGAYDGVYLDLENSHGGSFSRIKNQDGISGLQSIYGLTQINIDNSNCIYTSSFRNGGGSSIGAGNGTGMGIEVGNGGGSSEATQPTGGSGRGDVDLSKYYGKETTDEDRQRWADEYIHDTTGWN